MDRYAVVVGAVNIDIWGRTHAAPVPRDSNPGAVHCSPGGVGRNIACNLARLGVEVHLLTALGGDVWASVLADDCRQAGIDLSRALRIDGAASSSYVYFTGPEGEMLLAVCDGSLVERIDPALLAGCADLLSGAALVAADGNLSAAAVEYLCAHCTAPIFVDPVSTAKAMKFLPVLHRIHTIKPNALEAAALTGIADPAGAARALVDAGVQRAFVSDGANGIYAAAADGTACHLPCCLARPVNVTGGGDAVMAALCRSFLDGCTTEQAARRAMAAGAIAVESPTTISSELNLETLLARAGE